MHVTQRISKWLAQDHTTHVVLSYSKDGVLSMIKFQGGVPCPAGLVIKNCSCHLDLFNGTAKDLLHFVLAHLGKFYSRINSIRLLLNTNSFFVLTIVTFSHHVLI